MNHNYSFLLIILSVFRVNSVLFAQLGANNLQVNGFKQNKGQVCNQYHQPRTDILFSGADDKLTYFLQHQGISYQFCTVSEWRNQVAKGLMASAQNQQENKIPAAFTFYRLDVNWINSNPDAYISMGEALEGYENYYSESCPLGALSVKSFESVTYQQIYKGIDLKWYHSNGHLKYDYLVAAGADYTKIEFEISGAEHIAINSNGDLVITTPMGELVEDAPKVFQNAKKLDAWWVLNGTRVSFEITNIDHQQPFVIDPMLRLWGTFYGGGSADYLTHTSTDNNNNVFMVGQTLSSTTQNIATQGSHQVNYGGPGTLNYPGDGFAAKFNAQGVRQWATYYGGSGYDLIINSATDAAGNIFVTGSTNSTNTVVIATGGAFQTNFAGNPAYGGDVFIAKLNANGVRQWGTYYGDTLDDWGLGICVDGTGNVYVTGGVRAQTANQVFGTSGSHQPLQATSTNPEYDAFLAKFSGSGARIWSTYYGGSGMDYGNACTTDVNGDVYLVGLTASSTSSVMATNACHQYSIGSTNATDGFIARFNANGNRLWATYYGGTGNDYVLTCNVDQQGFLYITGATSSPSAVATPGSHQSSYGLNNDLFFARFTSAGVRRWASYYGGSGYEDWSFGAIDSKGYFYLSGLTGTFAGTVIATACSYQPLYGGGLSDCFLTRFDSTGTRLWGTYYGGTGNESAGGPNYGFYGTSISIDGLDNVYLAGTTGPGTNSLIIASPGSHQPAFAGGNTDAFMVKFDKCSTGTPTVTNLQVCSGAPATLSVAQGCSTQWFGNASGSNLLNTGSVFTINPIYRDSTFWLADFSCGVPSTLSPVQVSVIPSPSISITADASIFCKGETHTLIATGGTNYNWQTFPALSPSIVITPTVTTTHVVLGYGSNGCSGTASITLSLSDCLGMNSVDNNLQRALKVFPDPAANKVYVLNKHDAQLQLTNQLGQDLQCFNIEADKQYELNVTELPEGIYFIYVNTSAFIVTRKLVVSR